jgi:hypothetical protein
MLTTLKNNNICYVGEFGAIKRTDSNNQPIPPDWSKHLAARNYFDRYVVSSAMSRGLIPIYWDNGASDFGIISRYTGAVTGQALSMRSCRELAIRPRPI